LDIGCGVGAAALEIAKTSGLDVTGIDVDLGQIKTAQARAAYPNLKFSVMDASNSRLGVLGRLALNLQSRKRAGS
jgi:cyclopropane fatty-acyl-phospholipid synthase-like methyltransferase